MTAIGKIFVIINLLFSLVVAGFIVMIYAKSANWNATSKQWSTWKQTADASQSAVEQDLVQERANHAKALRELEEQVKVKDTEIAKAKEDVKAQATALEKIKQGANGEQFSLKAVQAELEKRKDEVAGLEQQIKDKDDAITKAIKGKNEANDARVASEIKAQSYQGKAERLEARVRETEMEIVKLRRTGNAGGSGGTSFVATTSNAPAQYVEGIVTEKNGDLLRLSIGSDAGLEKGHTLDVYRLKPTPQYLGQIRLTDVRASEAVGVPVDRLKYPAQKGDLVASDVSAKK